MLILAFAAIGFAVWRWKGLMWGVAITYGLLILLAVFGA